MDRGCSDFLALILRTKENKKENLTLWANVKEELPMTQHDLKKMITQEFLDTLLPLGKSDRFFEALYGDASEGAYDIRLSLVNVSDSRIVLAFNLHQRPGKCMVCSLTYGLPNVFSRHPLINIKGMVDQMVQKGIPVKDWQLGDTQEDSSVLHTIPLYLNLD